MRLIRLLFTVVPAIQATSAFSSSFDLKHPSTRSNAIKKEHHHHHHLNNILQIRGGDIVNISPSSSSSTAMSSLICPATEALSQALVSGTPLTAVGALYAVASLTVVPLTYIRQAYSFSVGYGLSVATMAIALLASFPFAGGNFALSQIQSSTPSILTVNALVYGLRLAGYILTRQYTVESKRKQFQELDKSPRLKRTPLALGVSLLYAFMVSPALFALRGGVAPGSTMEKFQVFFTGLSVFGTILESIADQHKYQVKKQNNNNAKEGREDLFVGPTTWSYKLCRHPNYLGEILFWLGLFGAGSVSFGKSIVPWICGVLGLWGILSIMLGASSRLDKKQSDKYGGQAAFEEWKKDVTFSVIPLIK